MIYEFRKYTVAEGRTSELVERFKNHTLTLFDKHGITPMFFSWDIKKEPNIFFYGVSFLNREQQKESWNSFMEDVERIKIWDISNKNGKLVVSIESETFDAVEIKGAKDEG